MKLLSLLKAIILLLSLTVMMSSCNSYKEPTTTQMKKALQLFGGRVNVSVSQNVHDTVHVLFTASDILNNKGIAEGFLDVAALIDNDPFGYIRFFPEKTAKIEQVKKILGKEEEKEVKSEKLGTNTSNVTWYRYGWLSFGDVEGMVEVIQLNCRKK